MWWGRSPLPSVRAALLASLVDAPESKESLLERIGRLQSGEYTQIGSPPTVFDPFCGYGGIPIAAQELGLPVIAGDLNPVAVMLTKAATEIPDKFAGCSPVNPFSLLKTYSDTEGLAEDVQYYGGILRELVHEKLRDLYPNEPEGTASAWIWARTVKCPNPACGCQMPMVTSFVLNSKPGQEAWIEPSAVDGEIIYTVQHSPCPKEKETNKYAKNGSLFRCPCCGEITSDEYVKSAGKEQKFGYHLMAVAVDTEKGRIYKTPDERQRKAAECERPENIPTGSIPNNSHWFSPPGFGLTEYSDLFTNRQLTMLTTFCDLLLEVQDKIASDALAAGMDACGGSLATGGTGAFAYSQAVSIYLAFVIDKLADGNSSMCSWRTAGGNLRNTFGRQSIIMVWNFAEGNPFSSITGNFNSALKSVVSAVQKLPCGKTATVYQGDAVQAEFPENVLVCTEFPYYKNIGYAHLSDYFYIWLRRSLKPMFPDLFNPMVTSKHELTTVGQYAGMGNESSDELYESNLRSVVNKIYHCSSEQYPALLFYEIRKADLLALDSLDNADCLTALEKMLDYLKDAGFAVSAMWPLRAEPFSESADAVRILIVAKKTERLPLTQRRAFINSLKRELPEKLMTMLSVEVSPEDKFISALGMGLELFTRHTTVLNADGSKMNVHDALQIIAQEVNDYLFEESQKETTERSEAEEI